MALFKQHVMFSSALGAGYAIAAKGMGVEWSHALLAGGMCGVAGMLPDLDSDSGRPVREIFGVTAAMAPLLLLSRMDRAGVHVETMILVAGAMYFFIRFGLAWIFRRLTVHRGMFHSLPAAVIAAELVFLTHDCDEPYGRAILAGGVLVGFLSHLALDDVYGLGKGILHRGRKLYGGSSFKLASDSLVATAVCWLILTGLSYLVAIDQGFAEPIHAELPPIMSEYVPKW